MERYINVDRIKEIIFYPSTINTDFKWYKADGIKRGLINQVFINLLNIFTLGQAVKNHPVDGYYHCIYTSVFSKERICKDFNSYFDGDIVMCKPKVVIVLNERDTFIDENDKEKFYFESDEKAKEYVRGITYSNKITFVEKK